MLRRWIEEIRKQPDLYKTDCWKYHVSGNTLELSVLPAYMKDRDLYRCSVIVVGQVLKALSFKIEKKQSNFHIQSFPSIENPGLVATIRMDESTKAAKKSNLKNNHHQKNTSLKKAMSELANQYHLQILKVNETSKLHLAETDIADYKYWFILYSNLNNPFMWLNVGYWKENIRNDFQHLRSLEEYKIIDFCNAVGKKQSCEEIPENVYLQSIIGMNTASIASKQDS